MKFSFIKIKILIKKDYFQILNNQIKQNFETLK